MYLSRLTEIPTSRDVIDAFKGYNHKLQIDSDEFYDMENMTSEFYPVMSPRRPRGTFTYPTSGTHKPNGMIAKDAFCYVDGTTLYINGTAVSDFVLTDSPKQLVSMGAYLIIMPDRKYINTMDTSDKGSMEATYTSTGTVSYELCDVNGDAYSNVTVSSTEPANPTNMMYWLDTSSTPHVLKQYSSSSKVWTQVATTYIKIKASGIGEMFTVYDGVRISGIDPTLTQLQDLNAVTSVLYQVYHDATTPANDYIVVIGILDTASTQSDPITIARKMPQLDFLIESENRIWGCRYGLGNDREFTKSTTITGGMVTVNEDKFLTSFPDAATYTFTATTVLAPNPLWWSINGELVEDISVFGITYTGTPVEGNTITVTVSGVMVNEIYACKQGDFKNWNCFMGISTDSYYASVGTDGAFTGAVTHLGYPIFFKENCLHKVYGNMPSNYQIQTTSCRGVQYGAGKSLAIVNEYLFYKSRHGICRYDGSLPVDASDALGEFRYNGVDNTEGSDPLRNGAVAGGFNNKYYISMKNEVDNTYHLFVLDTAKGMWHREDDTRVDDFCCYRDTLYYVPHESTAIKSVSGSDSEVVEWMAETGIIAYPSIKNGASRMSDKKYLSRIVLRMSLGLGSRVHIYAQYDSSGDYEHLATLNGTNLRSFSVPLKPKRCDHFRLRLEGQGDAKIFSMAKTFEEGSDL